MMCVCGTEHLLSCPKRHVKSRFIYILYTVTVLGYTRVLLATNRQLPDVLENFKVAFDV